MCGIVGVLSQNPKQHTDLETALAHLYHRGPDDRGMWKDSHIHLGHTRLSILDISSLGHQPMSYHNERFWITFNGEIYNYLELRQELQNLGYQFISHSDTEVILAAYHEWGLSCLHRLRGMFAFGIWDTQEKTLFLARDRVGEKPLYYWHHEHTFYFASELKTLLSLLPSLPELDPAALDLYFHYQYVPEPLTPFAGIRKLPAAHYIVLTMKNWHPQPKQYWSLAEIEPRDGDPIPLIRQELERVIELTLRSDVPIGVALSGGLDSSAITAIATAHYKDTLQAFSVGYPDRPAHDERAQAQELAQYLGIPFFEIELNTRDVIEFFPELVKIMDDPIADIAAYGHYSVMKLAQGHGIKVMLTGIGGDELFWGYPYLPDLVRLTQKKQKLLEQFSFPSWFLQGVEHITGNPAYQRLAYHDNTPSSIGSLLAKGIAFGKLSLRRPHHAVYYNLRPNFIQALRYRKTLYSREFLSRLQEDNPFQPFQLTPKHHAKDAGLQICQILFDSWLVSNCLSLGDRVSMASSVETRLPLLDYKLIELVMGLRQISPDDNLGAKFWLKSALKHVVPDEIFERPKRGFEPPVQKWMQALIGHYIEWLQDAYLVEKNILSRAQLQKMLHEFKGHRHHTFMLYKVLLLETWCRKVAFIN